MPPARTQSSKPLSKADDMEMRVARLWFWEGYFSRCRIDLRRHYHPEQLIVTDLDLLAYDIGPTLQTSRTIGEVKTGRGKSAPKPLDRIIWLRGLVELVGVEHAELVSSNGPSPRARKLARSIGVSAQSQDDVERREQLANVAEVEDVGSHGPRAFLEQNWVHEHCKSDQNLERAFWFLRSEVWFNDEVTACKRLFGLFRQLGSLWTGEIEDDDSRALRWLLAETVSAFTLNVVRVASEAIRAAPELLAAELGEQLSAGLTSADVMRRIAANVDKFVGGVLAEAKAPASVKTEAMGALHPEPPEWTEQFVDLVSRLAMNPNKARVLPRQMDVLAYDRIVWRREVNPISFERLNLGDPEAGRLVRLVGVFLRSQAAFIEVVDRALSTDIRAARPTPDLEVPTDQPDTESEPPVQPPLLEAR